MQRHIGRIARLNKELMIVRSKNTGPKAEKSEKIQQLVQIDGVEQKQTQQLAILKSRIDDLRVLNKELKNDAGRKI